MFSQFDRVKSSFNEWWQREDVDATPEPIAPPKLGLVLGGGGGKGGAHLGVLDVLEELDVPIDLIVGSSIGAAVGVLYAAGLSLDEIAQGFRDGALRRIFTPDPTRTGLIGGRKREQLFYKLLEDRTFADLRIPCAVMAADLVHGREVVINEGPVVPAVMASSAIPGIFPPVLHNDQVLMDGSTINGLPVDVAERLGAQQVIAVELSSTNTASWSDELASMPENPVARLATMPRQLSVASRAFNILLTQVVELRLAQHPPALLLRPEVGHIPLLDLAHPEESRPLGEAAARAVTKELRALRAWRLAEAVPESPPVPRRFSFGWRLPLGRGEGAEGEHRRVSS